MNIDATLLTIDNVCLSYGERHVLCHIRQVVKSDDFIVLTGPNGGGKTTLLRLMAGLLPPTAGKIVRNEGVSIGYLPQYRHIDRRFPTTVQRIVESGLLSGFRLFHRINAEERDRVDEVISLLGIEPLRRYAISDLSGGQWQRALLARALVSRPALLLLDEPETHLDEASRNELYNILTLLRNRCAIAVVSHNEHQFPQLPERRIWHIENGAVKEQAVW